MQLDVNHTFQEKESHIIR